MSHLRLSASYILSRLTQFSNAIWEVSHIYLFFSLRYYMCIFRLTICCYSYHQSRIFDFKALQPVKFVRTSFSCLIRAINWKPGAKNKMVSHISAFTPSSSQWSLPIKYSDQYFYILLTCSSRAACHTYPIHLWRALWYSVKSTNYEVLQYVFSPAPCVPSLFGPDVLTERHCRVVSTPTSYSEGPKFKSRPKGRLCWQTFSMVFLSPSKQMPR